MCVCPNENLLTEKHPRPKFEVTFIYIKNDPYATHASLSVGLDLASGSQKNYSKVHTRTHTYTLQSKVEFEKKSKT